MTSRHSAASRWAAWAFALALLLKAAVPMLATVSAQLQGKTLVEVCTVYGVATVALDAQGGATPMPAPAGHDGAHPGDHCVLSGLLALAAPQPVAHAFAATIPLPATRPVARVATAAVRDAEAHWMSRLKHGPPPSA